MTTKVIFKKFKEGDIIACFPELTGNMNPETCESYQHVGQHGSASSFAMAELKPATQAEYTDLLQELVSIGYDDLVIVKRFTYKDYQNRWQQTLKHSGYTDDEIKTITRKDNYNG